jgi:hypothetical protein
MAPLIGSGRKGYGRQKRRRNSPKVFLKGRNMLLKNILKNSSF